LKFKIIPHTLPIPNFKYKKNHVNRVVFVGRITPIKRVDILIDAINYINSFRINNLHLDIIGDGDTGYINYLKAKGGGNINFTGQLNGDDKNSAILNSDFLILPSYRENFGNVVIEALSLGIPALVTDESPWRILNITNSGGTFDGSLYDLIFQIINIYNKDYSSLSNNARSVFLEYFSNEKIYEYYK
jgi:glycosyltransferase involved in cell wall biosynthesis